MNEPHYLYVEPGRLRRERTQEYKRVNALPPGPSRAEALAGLTRAFHDEREINMAMQCAQQCIDDDAAGLALLSAAYRTTVRPDRVIDDLGMLAHLGRWMGSDPILRMARDEVRAVALAWCGASQGREREQRLERLERRFDPGLAAEVEIVLDEDEYADLGV